MRAARFSTGLTTSFAARWYTALPSLTKPVGAPAALPALDWEWEDGVKPLLSKRQVELHYLKHHKAYVDNLNNMAKADYDGKTIEEIAVIAAKKGEQGLFNQAAQHFNHSFYWKCIKPNGSAIPADLEAAINDAFGSVADFKKQFEAKGMANFGSGWTWLVLDPADGKLKITNTSNAGFPITENLRPLLTADVWEHAYYKDFENKRADYLHEIWSVVNWDFVAAQLKIARQA